MSTLDIILEEYPISDVSVEAQLERKWPYDIGRYNENEIQQYCVEDTNWTAFRQGMKRLPTASKLKMLHMRRLSAIQSVGHLPRKIEVQIDHYINTLRRGGFLSIDGYILK